MICKKCGYDYPAKELKCPYCGEVNPLGEKWKNEENLARKETLLTKARVIHSMPLYVADKVMNVILLVITAVTALTFLVLAIVFGLEGIHITRQHNQASVQEAEELFTAEDYVGLYDYLKSHQVYGQEGFKKYTERVRLYDDYHAFLRDLFQIQQVLDWGFERQLLLSLDTTAQRLKHYTPDGIGLTYLLHSFLPMLKNSGVPEKTIDKICRENCASALRWKPKSNK